MISAHHWQASSTRFTCCCDIENRAAAVAKPKVRAVQEIADDGSQFSRQLEEELPRQ
jgi:hypothetical protein